MPGRSIPFDIVKRCVYTLGVFALASACASLTVKAVELPDPCQEPDRPRLSDLYEGQVDYLLRAYYPVNYLDDERKLFLLSRFDDIQQRNSDVLTERFNALQPFEQECLNQVFKDQGALDGRLLTLQDFDADGVLDFRINYTGEFVENDSDADGDGLDNVVDVFPFDSVKASVSDVDDDGIADHLDWSNEAIYTVDQTTRNIQRRLYKDFGVLLVEGNQAFDPAAVKVIEDVMYQTLDASRSVFRDKSVIKYIFSAKQAYIGNDYVIYGEVPAGLQRMYLYEAMFDTLNSEETRIAAYLTMLHEAVHGLQYAMDFPDNLPSLLAKNVHEVAPNFIAELNALNWQIDMDVPAEPTGLVYTGFTYNEVEQTAFEQIYAQGDLAIRISDLEKLYYSDEALDVRYGVINAYSLENIWEWHAEYVTASVLDRIYKAAEQMLSASEFDAIHACVEAKLLALYTEDYTYKLERADPAIMATLESLYPIADDKLRYLATEYVIEPFTDCGRA